MITRIVKLHIEPSKADEFIAIFENSKEKIRGFEGCCGLKLLRLKNEDKNLFFTYSHWESESNLDKYRHSELFLTTWAATKLLFDGKPEAWTVDELYQL